MTEKRLAGEVKVHDTQSTQPGYVLFSAYNGDEIVLIDRGGAIVHSWTARPHVKLAELLPDGRLLYAWMRRGMVEVDWWNVPLWRYNCQQHHDFYRHRDGRVLALCHEYRFNPRIFNKVMFKNCWFVEVDRWGNELWEWHSDEHIDELVDMLGLRFPAKQEDWTHTNTVEALPANRSGEQDARFREGNVLFSHRNYDTIGVIDRQCGQIVWAWGPGELDNQHMPTMQPDGRILCFDNGTARKWSRVIEVDPLTGRITWQYRLPDHAYSPFVSGQERLPNGNVLICAGNPGVVLEVEPEGRIAWEFHSKLKSNNPAENTALYRAMFYPPEMIEPMLRW